MKISLIILDAVLTGNLLPGTKWLIITASYSNELEFHNIYLLTNNLYDNIRRQNTIFYYFKFCENP
jgi:hypothetical protein